MGILTYNETTFLMDGQPYRVLSGAIHYFRVLPEYWEDRLTKLKACGFNTVETYTCWNLHERRRSRFDFTGRLDLGAFITAAEKVGLNVIIRPGPYICAEWDMGGLPSWLLEEHIPLRCNEPKYLEAVKPYYEKLFDIIRPHLAENGGGVVMMQVENEYGSYGDDKEYLRAVETLYREGGITCPLFTSDGSDMLMLSGGTLPHLLSVANFGSNAPLHFARLRAFKPHQPTMCGEFWCGWFDHWYDIHHIRTAENAVQETKKLLEDDGNVNFYMFHGGTNFGFTNGANCVETDYQPTITSYDYSAPLTEAGDRTEIYYGLQKLIADFTGNPIPDIPCSETPKAAYGKVTLTECAPLLSNLDALAAPVRSAAPMTMEALGQDFGYVLYSTTFTGPFEKAELILDGLHDRAVIYVNGKIAGIQERSRRQDKIELELGVGETARVDILVENMGRINFGPALLDRKGILNGVRLGYRHHFGWEMRSLPMEALSGLAWESLGNRNVSQFLRGTLTVDAPADTFVELPGFTKGIVLVNGFNLGRYYNPAGPQKTLYVPAPLLKTGANEIIVFESDGYDTPEIEFFAEPKLG